MVLKKWGASHLYHWIQNDPIIDYLELYHSDKKYRPYPNYDFEALQNRDKPDTPIQWKQSILSSLELHCQKKGIRLVDHPSSVLQEIEKNTEGMSNGYLCMRNEYATVDLILTSRLVSCLPSACPVNVAEDVYTLCFWSTTQTPSLYVLCKIAFAWQLFERLTSRHAQCVLVLSDMIVHVDPTKYIPMIEEGRQWLLDLHEEGSSWSIESPKVPDLRLLPNLGRKHLGWDKLKECLAVRWNEVSLVCHVGARNREILHSRCIYSLLDPRMIPCLETLDQVPAITKQIVREIQNKPSCRITTLSLPVLSFEETIISVDIESVSGLWHDKTKAGDTFIGALVIFPNGNVQRYVFFDPCLEKVLAQFHTFLKSYQNALLIHYTEADLSVIPNDFRTLDVHPLVREEYEHTSSFRSFGMYKFGLKHVTERLYGDLYSSSTVKNGCECSAALYHSVRLGTCNPEGQLLLSQVEEYNSIDLYALAYLFKTLLSFPKTRETWKQSVKIKTNKRMFK